MARIQKYKETKITVDSLPFLRKFISRVRENRSIENKILDLKKNIIFNIKTIRKEEEKNIRRKIVSCSLVLTQP